MFHVYFSVLDGSPDGFCSATVPCKDANSMCSSGICQCNSGYRNIDSECREGNDFNEKYVVTVVFMFYSHLNRFCVVVF